MNKEYPPLPFHQNISAKHSHFTAQAPTSKDFYLQPSHDERAVRLPKASGQLQRAGCAQTQ